MFAPKMESDRRSILENFGGHIKSFDLTGSPLYNFLKEAVKRNFMVEVRKNTFIPYEAPRNLHFYHKQILFY